MSTVNAVNSPLGVGGGRVKGSLREAESCRVYCSLGVYTKTGTRQRALAGLCVRITRKFLCQLFIFVVVCLFCLFASLVEHHASGNRGFYC